MSKLHAVLHIGVMKTATTTIQVWLGSNKAHLARQGIHLPESFGSTNHSAISMLSRHYRNRHRKAMPPKQSALLDRLRHELSHLDPSVRTVVFSGELMSEGLRDAASVAGLKELLDPHFGSYSVIVYLRRQDEQAASMLSTLIRVGKASPELVANPLAAVPFDYAQLLSAWCGVFGRDAVQPRIFQRDSLLGGDVVADFAAAMGVTISGDFAPREKNLNLSLNPSGQALLFRLTEVARANGLTGERFEETMTHSRVRAAVDRHFAGNGRMPTRAEAIAYCEKCRPSNEQVRAEWFPGRPHLFHEDFSAYPETASPQPGPEEVLDAAVTILLALAKAQARSRATAA